MRFLYVAPRFHPNQYPIIEGLINKGHEVLFCVSKVGSTEKHDGVSVRVMTPSLISRIIRKVASRKGQNHAENKMIFWFSPKYAEVKRCIKDYAPDVVIVRDRNLLSLSFVLACRKCKIKKVLLYNQSPVYSAPDKGIKASLKKMLFAIFPSKRITVCRYRTFPFEGKGFIADKNAYFVPFVARQQLKQERNYLKNGVVNIFDCGKFRPYKNHTLLVDALAILRDKGYRNFYATILGQADNDEEKAYYNALQEKITNAGLDAHIALKTSIPYDEMPEQYLKNDVFVLTSAKELANISILDSMSYGLATITTSYNGTADYIEPGKTGYVFKTEDAQNLSEKIEKYLRDPQLIEAHGKQALKTVEEAFGFESYYKKLMTIIEEL